MIRKLEPMPSLQALIDLRDHVSHRSDYPKNATAVEFFLYLDKITGLHIYGKGLPVGDACRQWRDALG